MLPGPLRIPVPRPTPAYAQYIPLAIEGATAIAIRMNLAKRVRDMLGAIEFLTSASAAQTTSLSSTILNDAIQAENAKLIPSKDLLEFYKAIGRPMLNETASGTYDTHLGRPVTAEANRLSEIVSSDSRKRGKCTPEEFDPLKDYQEQWCAGAASCKPNMDQIDIMRLTKRNQMCVEHRIEVMDKCFDGGDQGHKDKAKQDSYSCAKLKDATPGDYFEKLRKGQQCFASRENVMNYCFFGGDLAHREEAKRVLDAMQTCRDNIKLTP